MRDCNEMTPLHLLVMNKFDVLAIWLVHNGADINLKDRKMFSAVDYGLPSTQRELRIAAGEISGLHRIVLFVCVTELSPLLCCFCFLFMITAAPTGKKDEKQEAKVPQLYRSPSRKMDTSLMDSRRVEVRVHVDNGSYKTVRIGPTVTCGQLIQMACEKFNIPPLYASCAILFESKQGVERSVSASLNAFELRSHWPHIITANGNETSEQCFFVVCFNIITFFLCFSFVPLFFHFCVCLLCLTAPLQCWCIKRCKGFLCTTEVKNCTFILLFLLHTSSSTFAYLPNNHSNLHVVDVFPFMVFRFSSGVFFQHPVLSLCLHKLPNLFVIWF